MTQPTQSLFGQINAELIVIMHPESDYPFVKESINTIKRICDEREQRLAEAEKALNAVVDAFEYYEKHGEICPFEGNPMIYASTLQELNEAACFALVFIANHSARSGIESGAEPVCETCKGSGGEYDASAPAHPANWYKCEECDGTGKLAQKPNDLLSHLGVIKARSKDWPEFMRTGTQPAELEMHRADYAAIKEYGFESPGELLAAWNRLHEQEPALVVRIEDRRRERCIEYLDSIFRDYPAGEYPLYTHPAPQVEPVAVPIPRTWRPWKIEPLWDWSIVGMNHYHKDGQEFLFVAITKDGQCLIEEGRDEESLWIRLRDKAIAAAPKAGE